MQKRCRLIAVTVVWVLLSLFLTSCSQQGQQASNEKTYESRSKVRVGCILSEEYDFFTQQLFYLGQSLEQKGWIAELPASLRQTDGAAVWNAICKNVQTESIVPDADCFYNMDLMDESQREAAFLAQESPDLMLVFGTAAGVWLTQHADRLSFDYMVFASADPITAGIVKSETERCNPRSFAHVDPGRIKRQIELAYAMSEFDSIGVVYEDSPAAYSYSGIRFLESLSQEKHFQVQECHVDEPRNAADYDRYYRELKEAYHSMLGKIDVLYITTGMIEDEKLPWLLSEVHEAGIITVAETSESQVENGAMMHITMSDAAEEGQFAARTVLDYIDGTPIDALEQVFQITPHISLNQTTVQKTGAVVPMSIYLIADNVYGGDEDAE